MTPFDELAPVWLEKLKAELDLTTEQAAGILGNLGYESGGFAKLREIGQSGDNGGWGAAQWTGPRRRAFLAYAEAHGLDWHDDAANYGFLLTELRSSAYKAMIDSLRECATVDQATWLIGQVYERPGGTTDTHLPGYDGRLDYARRALAGAQGQAAPTPVPSPALAMQTALKAAGYDPGPLDGIWGSRSQAAFDVWKHTL